MKFKLKTIILTLGLLCLMSSFATAEKARKLPLGAYIKSAKIEILSGDFERYKTAKALLDSLFMHYGPHGEALHLIEQMMVDYIDKEPNLFKKMDYVEVLVAYNDSLHIACDKKNKEVKSNYKKGCDEYIPLSDSVLVKYWRDYYNAGIKQMNFIDELKEQRQIETDSSYIETLNIDIQANVDSCVANMKLALILDPSNYRGYIGIGSVYEKVEDYEQAAEWYKKGLEATDDRAALLLNIAYTHLRIGEYCEAIPFLKEQIEVTPEDTISMINLVICYNNCKMFDSALALNYQILEQHPDNADALNNVGRYFNEQVRMCSDSISSFQQANNETESKKWNDKRNEMYDSSMVYFKRVTEVTPDDFIAWEQYGTIAALRGNFDEAANAFTKLTELKPEDIDYWRFLGDCQLNNQNWNESIAAYERVVAVNDSEVDTWERLYDLYKEIKQNDKAAAAQKKINSLK